MASSDDQRDEYYEQRLRAGQRKYRQFHLPSVRLFLGLIYSHDVLMAPFARRLAAYGLSPSGFNTLMILRHYDGTGCPLHEISHLLLITRASMTGLVDLLEKRGWVRRMPHERDKRVRLAVLTPEGDALLERILPEHYAAIRCTFSGLSDEEQAVLTELLRKMRQSVREAGHREESCALRG